jgi:CheY-like chemotaxis protein
MPHLTVMDFLMPIMNGLDAARHLTQRHPDILILMITSDPSRELEVEARAAGIKGLCAKASCPVSLKLWKPSSAAARTLAKMPQLSYSGTAPAVGGGRGLLTAAENNTEGVPSFGRFAKGGYHERMRNRPCENKSCVGSIGRAVHV